MSPLEISLSVCAILVAGVLLGAGLRHALPDHHLDSNAKDAVRLGCALVATISGMVLGLLTNSANNNFNTQRDEIRQMAATLIQLDHHLNEFGPEALPARRVLRQAVDVVADRIWNEGKVKVTPNAPFTATTAGDAVYQAIRALTPTTDAQRFFQTQAVQSANTLLQMRLVLFEQSSGGIPVPFLVVLVFWLAILFTSFSLFSPLSPTAFTALVLIALCASGAIFLILEMYQPFSGIMQISSEPLRKALAPLSS
jgi:hypothetical protein